MALLVSAKSIAGLIKTLPVELARHLLGSYVALTEESTYPLYRVICQIEDVYIRELLRSHVTTVTFQYSRGRWLSNLGDETSGLFEDLSKEFPRVHKLLVLDNPDNDCVRFKENSPLSVTPFVSTIDNYDPMMTWLYTQENFCKFENVRLLDGQLQFLPKMTRLVSAELVSPSEYDLILDWLEDALETNPRLQRVLINNDRNDRESFYLQSQMNEFIDSYNRWILTKGGTSSQSTPQFSVHVPCVTMYNGVADAKDLLTLWGCRILLVYMDDDRQSTENDLKAVNEIPTLKELELWGRDTEYFIELKLDYVEWLALHGNIDPIAGDLRGIPSLNHLYINSTRLTQELILPPTLKEINLSYATVDLNSINLPESLEVLTISCCKFLDGAARAAGAAGASCSLNLAHTSLRKLEVKDQNEVFICSLPKSSLCCLELDGINRLCLPDLRQFNLLHVKVVANEVRYVSNM